MKVNRRRSGINAVQVRLLCAGVLLLAAGFLALSGSRSRPIVAQAPASTAPTPIAFPAQVSAPASDLKSQAAASFSHMPLIFEPNVGQTAPGAKFMAHGAGYGLYLDSDGATISLRSRKPAHAGSQRTEALRMKLANASQTARVTGAELLPGKTNYLIGNDPSKWHRNVPQFARVRYENVYPGINLVFYGNQGQLEYDFQVAPGANPQQAELEFDGLRHIALSDGTLTLQGQGGDVRLEAPNVYQEINGTRRPVEGRFVMRAANRVGFEIGAYDRSRELIIDPVLTYSTYFGGSGSETSPSVAVDNAKFIYLAGSTTSTDLPTTTGVKQGTLAGAQNIFIVKLSSIGGTSGIQYLTYLGGEGTDTNVGIEVDGGGNAYVAGTTTSTLFPTTNTNAYQANIEAGSEGTQHVFVSVLDSLGATLKYSSYLSGNGDDIASGMAIDNKGDLFVTGTTTSSDAGSTSIQFPASSPPQAQPFQTFPRSAKQFFVTKVNTVASGIGSIAYSTYFGGGTPSDGVAIGGGIAVDTTGNIYFSGTTNFTFTGTSPTTDFPILNAYQPCLDTPPPTIVVTPITCTGTLTTNDAFVAKLNPAGSAGSGQLLWSTYLGGNGDDSSTALALDSGAANIYITGATNSTDITLPLSTASYQDCLNTPVNPTVLPCASLDSTVTDAYIARLNNPTATTQSLTYYSYLGGTGNDVGSAITVDTASGAVLTGYTESTDFPIIPNALTNPLCTTVSPCVIQSQLLGARNAFYARINTAAATGQTDVGQYVTYFGGSGSDQGTGIALDTNLVAYLAGDTTSPNLQTASPYRATLNGPSDAFVLKLGTSADLAVTGKLTLSTGQQYISAGSDATFTYTVTNNGPDVATNITLNDDLTGIPITFKSASATSGSCSTATATVPIACTIGSLQSGSTATVTIVVVPTTGGNFNGGSVIVSSTENDPNPGNNTTTVSGVASDFTIGISPENFTVAAAGDSAQYAVALAPVPFFGTAITLSVSSGLPSGATSSFTTSSVTLNGTPSSSVLNIATTARPITVASNNSKTWRPLYAVWFAFPGLALVGLGASGRRRRRLLGLLVAGAVLGLIALQPACSSKAAPPIVGGTPAGTYTLTVTATAGTVSHNVPFTLTVP